MEKEFPKGRLKWAPLFVISGAAVISGILFLLIPMTQILNPVKEADLIVREVVLLPPPPQVPPPPESAEPLPEPPPPELVQVPPPIVINSLDVSLSAGTGDAIAIGVPSPDLVVQDIASEIESMFTFDDLDEKPRPSGQPSYRFPPSLVRRGVKEGLVVVQIDILPSGRVEFVKIVSATHDELADIVLRIIGRFRFSKPIVAGRPARVRGNFPLRMRAPD